MSTIPTALKQINPFIQRATQMEKADPLIAYFCQLWAVQIILSKSLHTADAESTAYATNLLDTLEQGKADLKDQEALTDDLVGQAYVEAFALKVFNNADNTLRARKCTRQTADTFLAAATFFDLLKLFGEQDKEIIQKIKFAKFHASRIIKAINAGEDPNPPPSPVREGAPNEALGSPSNPPAPTVEDDVDEELRAMQQQMAPPPSVVDEPLNQSRGVSPLPPVDTRFPPPQPTEPSPIESSFPQQPSAPPKVTSYFPSAPATAPSPALDLPQPPSSQPDDFYTNVAAPPPQPPPMGAQKDEGPPVTAYSMPPNTHPHMHHHVQPTEAVASAPKAGDYMSKTSGFIDPEDSESIAKAQKHAKWAISALNYDDIPTAVSQLRDALKTLGAA